MRMGIYTVCQLAFAVMLTGVLCLGSVVHPSVANATVYYVATTGNDSNSCSTAQNSSTPKRNIVGANGGFSCLHAGDTLYIRAGTYNDWLNSGQNAFPQGGTSWATAITIAGYPGETVIIARGLLIAYQPDGVTPLSYLIFDNLTADGPEVTGAPGVITHHIRFTDCDFGTGATDNVVVISQYTDFVEVTYSKIHDAPVSYSGGSTLTGTYGFYINGTHMLIDHNEIYNNTGYAIHQYNEGSTSVSNNVISNNIIHNNCFDDGQRNQGLGAIIVSNGSNNVVYNNILYDNGHNADHSKTHSCGALSLGSGSNNQLYNNTVYGSTGYGLELNTNSVSPVVQNNIIYNNYNSNAGAQIVDDGATTPVISNNLTNPTDPQFVNVGSNNFHLQSSSPAIDAGTTVSVVTTDFDGVSRPQGSAYDIGACEGVIMLAAPYNLHITL